VEDFVNRAAVRRVLCQEVTIDQVYSALVYPPFWLSLYPYSTGGRASPDASQYQYHQCQTLVELVDLALGWLTDRKYFKVQDEAYLPTPDASQYQAA
jgi:hypothetical protein